MSLVRAKLFLLGISFSLAIIVSLLFLKGAPRAFPLDDAYIHLTYAKNISTGHGFAFNPDEPSFGTSSPLWVLLLAMFIRWLEPHLLVRIIAIICLWSNFYLSSVIIWEQFQDRPGSNFSRFLISLLPSLFLGASGNFLWIVFSGMESALFSSLALDSVFVLTRKKPGIFGYILLGLLCLTRLEAVLLIPLILIWQWFNLENKKQIMRILISICLPLAFHLWAYFQLGSFFPSTRAGKLASDLFNSGLSIKGGWIFLVRHFHYLFLTQPGALIALALIFIGFISLIYQREEKLKIGPISLFSFLAILIFFYHDQFFRSTHILTPYHNLRYQVLFFPWLALCLARICGGLLLGKKIREPQYMVIMVLVAIFILSFSKIRQWRGLYINQALHIKDVHQKAGLWAKAELPGSARIACFDIGSLGFYSGRYVIDLGGLTDQKIYPYFRAKDIGLYLKEKNATHYIEMGTPGSERILGVKKDLGKLYQLKPVAYFAGRRIPEPVLLHSWEMKVFEIQWIKN